MQLKLVQPSMEWEKELIDFRNEQLSLKARFQGASFLERYESIEEYLAFLDACKTLETCPKDLVPSVVYLYVDLDSHELIGIVNIRLDLNDYLLNFGGNIGYTIVPKYRKQGHGTNMLKLTLPLAKQHGLDRVLVTCVDFNTASEKIILANGGVLEDIRYCAPDNVSLKRYWITL